MKLAFRATRAALVFLTRIPVGGGPYRDDEWRWAPAFFPLVGVLVGGVAGLVVSVASPVGAWAAAILGVGAAMLVTGALHEDGLADTADALGGAVHDRDRVREILKDSRIGVFGAAALFVSLALRVALLVELGASAPVAWLLAHALSRVPPVWQIATLPYVTEAAVARSPGVTQAGARQAWVATALGVVVTVLVLGPAPSGAWFGLAAALLGVGFYTGWRFRARAGGVTGDFLGATQQIAEIAVLAVLVLTTGSP